MTNEPKYVQFICKDAEFIKAINVGVKNKISTGYKCELNPPKDTLSTNNTDGWIEEGGSISEEVKIIEQRLLTSANNAC